MTTHVAPAPSWLLLLSVLICVAQIEACPAVCSCTQPNDDYYFGSYYVACDNLGLLDVPNSIEHRTTDLSLAGNQFYTLGFSSVTKLTNVHALYLQNNQFTNIDDATVKAFTSLPNLKAIDLSGNPWNCSRTSAMEDFVSWLETNRGPRPIGDTTHWFVLVNGYKTTCSSPPSLAGTRLDRIKLGDLQSS